MARRSLARTHSSRKLLSSLLDNPELPTFVARLNAPTLNKLIERVGLEDAGPLICLATDRQMRSLLDETLWSNLVPGKPEVHRPEEFIRWLDVLYEQGSEFLAERLFGLGADYIVLNFSQLVSVDDKGAILFMAGPDSAFGPDAFAEEFGAYLVTARYDDEWDITRAALVALQAERPDFCQHILSRCSRDPERPGVAQANLMQDTYGERSDAKETAGYVTPQSAAAFLALARQSNLTSLIGDENLDLVSARYFARLGAHSHTQDEAPVQVDDEEPAHDPVKFKELEDTLVEAEIIAGTSPMLLGGPEQGDVLPVKAALDGLQQSDPELFAERLSELVYLSNVLMTGTAIDGNRFDDVDAAHAVLATCNVAMTYLGESMGDDRAVREGLVRLFRIGWQMLHQIPMHAVRRLVSTLRSPEVTQRLAQRAWILSEVDATLDALIGHVQGARVAEVKQTLLFVSLVLELEACDALQAMINDYPRFALDGKPRYIESMDDITSIDRYLAALADYAKL